MPEEKIIISDTNPNPDESGGYKGTYGKRFYGQKDILGKPDMCRTTLWESQFHEPKKYLGTYEIEKKSRNNQDLNYFFREPKKTSISVLATKVADDRALQKWVLLMYRWLPRIIILGLGIAALIATLIWV